MEWQHLKAFVLLGQRPAVLFVTVTTNNLFPIGG
jgi:hypothetical protein